MKQKILILFFISLHIYCIAQVSINKPLILQLDSIYTDDVKYRLQLNELENNTSKSLDQKSKEREILSKLMREQDAINIKKELTYSIHMDG